MDKRPVLMLSTDPSHNAKCIPTGKRTRQGDDVLKPKVITDYNKARTVSMLATKCRLITRFYAEVSNGIEN